MVYRAKPRAGHLGSESSPITKGAGENLRLVGCYCLLDIVVLLWPKLKGTDINIKNVFFFREKIAFIVKSLKRTLPRERVLTET